MASLEAAHRARVLGVTGDGGTRAVGPDLPLRAGDRLVVHVATNQLAELG